MRVKQAPAIEFKCSSCSAANEGEPHEFDELHTMPPSFRATCAFCRATNICFPPPLLARAAAREGSSGLPALTGFLARANR